MGVSGYKYDEKLLGLLLNSALENIKCQRVMICEGKQKGDKNKLELADEFFWRKAKEEFKRKNKSTEAADKEDRVRATKDLLNNDLGGDDEKVVKMFVGAIIDSVPRFNMDTFIGMRIKFSHEKLVALEYKLWTMPEYQRRFCEMFQLVNERQIRNKFELNKGASDSATLFWYALINTMRHWSNWPANVDETNNYRDYLKCAHYKALEKTVHIYDPSHTETLTESYVRVLLRMYPKMTKCVFSKPKTLQEDACSCGVFAFAYATTIVGTR